VDTKEILQPSKDFPRRVQIAHKRVYQALSEKNGKKAGEEMAKHDREVERNLFAPMREMHLEALNLQDRRREGFLFLFAWRLNGV
jgi:hypothetical protein